MSKNAANRHAMANWLNSNRRRLALALLLGLSTTVALAWLAMFVPRDGRNYYGPPATTDLGYARTSDGYKIWSLAEGRNAWHHVVSYWFNQISGQAVMIRIEDYEANKADLNALPRHLQPVSVDDLAMQAWYREVGWPLPALTCSIHWVHQIRNADIIYAVKGGVQLPRDKDFHPRALPLTPVWPGFVVDWLVWSTVWFAPLIGIAALRRRRRRRKGLCVHCGYSLTGLPEGAVCPECGR